ncbi:hypothetical protein [Burkholderia sp. Ac-20365]|jgi:hypothetical protein|uniref:hypothetical protein n=1 Tax=Burkholderia sp. Ac-20365 TaxID=2703897 RepID=UPI00197C5FBF|nr:hypothetical protein [Burkholderia sp. Ac-20365]MBN3763487.1 hypothetical protein [Burkholderia sp. Ac-20365]
MSEIKHAVLNAGDAQAASSALLGDGAVIVWNDIDASGRNQFYEWHDKEHIPERLSIPGFRRGRRYVRPGHSPEWLTVYEAADLNVVVSPAYLERLNTPTPATVDTLRYFRNTSRAVCQIVHSVGSSSGGHILAMRVDVSAAQANAMKAYLCTDVFPRAVALTGVVACHLYMADQPGSHLNTAESDTREFDVPAWVVLVEATTPQAAEQARKLVDENRLEDLGATVRADCAIYSMEICRLASSAA